MHDSVAPLLGAFALDAIESEERENVEAHVAECLVCASEVAQHREVVASLVGDGASVPDGLWNKVVAGAEERPPPLELIPARRSSVGGFRSRAMTSLVSMATAAAVIAAIAGVSVIHQASKLQKLEEKIASGSVEQAAYEASSDPANPHVALASADGEYSVDAVLAGRGRAFILDSKLPDLSSDRTYQLWGITPTAVVSLGLLGNEVKPTAFYLPGGLTGLAITNEVRTGVVVSSTAPVVVAKSLPSRST